MGHLDDKASDHRWSLGEWRHAHVSPVGNMKVTMDTQEQKHMLIHTCHASCGRFTTLAHNKPRTLLLLCSWLSSTVNQSPWIPQTHHGACQDRRTTDGCQNQVHRNQAGAPPVWVNTTHHVHQPATLSFTCSATQLEYGACQRCKQSTPGPGLGATK